VAEVDFEVQVARDLGAVVVLLLEDGWAGDDVRTLVDEIIDAYSKGQQDG
jgi:hypothetical protein